MIMHIVNTMDYSIFFFFNGAPKAQGRMDQEQQAVGKHFDDEGGGLPSKPGQGLNGEEQSEDINV